MKEMRNKEWGKYLIMNVKGKYAEFLNFIKRITNVISMTYFYFLSDGNRIDILF